MHHDNCTTLCIKLGSGEPVPRSQPACPIAVGPIAGLTSGRELITALPWQRRAASATALVLPCRGTAETSGSGSWSLIAQIWSDPPSPGALRTAVGTCHGAPHVAPWYALLVSLTLGRIDREEPSALAPTRALDLGCWTTFSVDASGILDGARIPFWILRLLAELHAV